MEFSWLNEVAGTYQGQEVYLSNLFGWLNEVTGRYV